METVSKAIESVVNSNRSETKICLDSDDRLAAIDKLEIVGRPVARNYEMLVELANSLLETPVSLISIVTNTKQFFVSSDGLGEPWASRRETPLSHSFCQYVVQMDAPLVVNDSRVDPLVCENLAIRDLDVGSYLGCPLRTQDGLVLGSFCVIDSMPRTWTIDELATVEKFANLAVSELEKKIETLLQAEEYERRLRHAQKMEAIGQFTAGVAHDFNNVLTVIQNFVELLQLECRDQSKSSAYLEQIVKALDSAVENTQQLLTCSRPKSETYSPIVLRDVVAEFLPSLETTSENVQFRFDEKKAASSLVATRPGLINQILTNLCSNAIDAFNDKCGTITVDLDEVELDGCRDEVVLDLPAGKYVNLRVSDDGCGIAKETIDRLHEPYFTTKPLGRGTGLGLWIVFGIVKEHRGEIVVHSELGIGTQFNIYLPVWDDNA